METLPIAANQHQVGAPALAAESAARNRSLRRELADAIADAQAADRAARVAKQVADRGERAHHEAVAEFERLKTAIDRVQTNAKEMHATTCIEAFKKGEELPPAPALPEVDSDAMNSARTRMHALHIAWGSLATEHNGLVMAAEKAAARVAALADEIVFGELHALADEAVAAIELHWALVDRLKGLVAIDERRDAPRLRGFQEEFIKRIDRQQSAMARDPLMIERHRYRAYSTELAAEQERRWLDYARRLTQSADATFDLFLKEN